MNKNIEELMNFIDNSTCSYYAADTAKNILESNGFIRLDERKKWELKKEQKYYIEKNESSIIAFVTGSGDIEEDGFRIIGSHTDSPGFKIKPNPEMEVLHNYIKLNTEVYGGPIVSTWFDRPLSIAGRVILKGKNPLRPETRLLKVERPVVIIPNLCIHMNRNVNSGYEYNMQKDTLPLCALNDLENKSSSKKNFLYDLISSELKVKKEKILDFDLFLYDTTKAEYVGAKNEFVSSGRLDDLWMFFSSLKAINNSEKTKHTKIIAAFNNEEIGSLTSQGANSLLLYNILERIAFGFNKTKEEFKRALASSIMISADLVHAVHPNYLEKADPTNRPTLGKGPVIKSAASGSYSTDGFTSAVFKGICMDIGVPCQEFVNRSDMRGGTTIGPISASKLNIPVIDMGSPILSMHSIRELMAVKDNEYTIKAFTKFLNSNF
ncbi:M18 family aminopeptidase [Clostridium sp. BJN0001]|uniref:M18 family aminopeptidase n=1 Tax=Clostridium sp. BJN0001 TaxID=2930219 RepID=UPI001FD2A537|nr:M18 family aminopeptidase [Clostridium sp. BJN0001]